MAVFISVSTDAFAEARKGTRQKQPQVNVRRPLRGIQVKEDTYSVIRVMTSTGTPIDLFDSSSPDYDTTTGVGKSQQYSNFIIQHVAESRAEKQQIIETFGEDYVYFFGERPRFLNISGVLLNTSDFNWKSEFWANYEQHLRGTRLVEKNARVYLYFDDVVVEGYFLTASADLDSTSPHMLPFQFQLYVSNYAILSNVGSVFLSSVDNGAPLEGLEPFTHAEQMRNAQNAAMMGSTGGLTGFIAAASQFVNNASFAIQSTLDNFKEFYFARRLTVPTGIDSQAPELRSQEELQRATEQQKRAQFTEAPTNRPIHEMWDEYVERTPPEQSMKLKAALEADQRLTEASLALRSPEALEAKARIELEKHGVDTGSPSTAMLLLGRGAFAAAQYAAAFGIAQAKGRITARSEIDQATGLII